MSLRRVILSSICAGALATAALGAANAQGYGRPPAPVGGYDDDAPVRTAGSDDAAGLLVRIDKLESQMRQMNGQIEQLQFANRRLEDQMKKFQQDVDFRFGELGRAGGGGARPQKRGDLSDGATPSGAAPLAAEPAPAAPPLRTRRGDAFDPAAAPNAPGVPRAIGSLPASEPSGAGIARRRIDHRRDVERCTARSVRRPSARPGRARRRTARATQHTSGRHGSPRERDAGRNGDRQRGASRSEGRV